MSEPEPLSFQAPAPEALAPLFPHFEIMNLIACGGMGAVYKARQASLDRIVAIKILPPELGTDREYALRFQSEARLMANLSNPYIVTVFDFGLAGNYLYIVMEYVDGETLHQMLQREGKLKYDLVLRSMGEICRGLDYAHEKGLVHLDIKPGNVMINSDGEARVLDFGLAKLLDPRKGSAEESMGTPDYAAPERLATGATVDNRADIYSLGIMFYELLTGAVPRGTYSPASKMAGVDPAVDSIIAKCTKQDPSARYQRAQEILAAVIKLRRSSAKKKQVGIAAPVATGKAAGAAKSTTSAATAYQQMMAGKGSKGWVAWVISGISLAAIVIVLAMFGAFGGGEKGNGELAKGGKKPKPGPNREEVGKRPREERPRNPRVTEEGGRNPVRPVPKEEPDRGVDPDPPVNPPQSPSFPPEGLIAEIEMVRKAMEEGAAFEELELNFLKLNDGKFYYVIPRRMAWGDAEKFASENGAHMATITSKEEEDFVRETWFGDNSEAEDRGSRPLWLGGKLGEDGWTWITDEEWDYAGWNGDDPPKKSRDETLVALIHEISWVGRAEDDRYSALIEWDSPASVAGPPMHEIDPTVAEAPKQDLTPLQKLRAGFEQNFAKNIAIPYETEILQLGDQYITAMENLVSTCTIPERTLQATDELNRFKDSRVMPPQPDPWPDMGNIQSVLLTQYKRITDSYKTKRQQLIRVYDEALLRFQADFNAKLQWDQVELVKAERQRIEEIRLSPTIEGAGMVLIGLEVVSDLVERDRSPRYATAMPDGNVLVSGADGMFRSFNIEDEGELDVEWDAGHSVGRCEFLPGGDKYVALDPEGKFEVWDLSRQQAVFSDEEKEGAPIRLTLSPDGSVCVVETMPFQEPKTGGMAGIRIWAMADPPEKREFISKAVGRTAFSPNGKYLALSTKKGLFFSLWGETEPLWSNEDCTGGAVMFLDGGNKIICGRVIVDTRTGETVTDLRLKEPERFAEDAKARNASVNVVDAMGDDQYVVFGLVGGGLEVWDLVASEMIFSDEDAHTGFVTDLVISKDDSKLVTAGRGGGVKLWKVLK